MKNTQHNRKMLLIGLALSAVLCTLAFIASSLIYKNCIKGKTKDRIEELADTARASVNSSQDDSAGYIDYYLQQYETESEEYGYEPLSCRFVSDNGGVLSDSHLKSHLVVTDMTKSGESGAKSIYICYPDINEQADSKYSEMSDRAESLNKSDKQGDYVCLCTSAYLDGQYFYPCLSIVNTASGDFTTVENCNFAPEDTNSMNEVEYRKGALKLQYMPSSGYYVDQSDEVDAKLGSKLDNYVKKNSDISSIKSKSVNYSDGTLVYSYPVRWTDSQGAQRNSVLFCAVNAPLYLPVVIGSVVVVFAGTMFFVYRFAKKEKDNEG